MGLGTLHSETLPSEDLSGAGSQSQRGGKLLYEGGMHRKDGIGEQWEKNNNATKAGCFNIY